MVSDIQIHLKPRTYPRRDLLASDIWDQSLEPHCSQPTKDLLQECYKALSQDQDNEFNFYNYNTNNHRHMCEMIQELEKFSKSKIQISFNPHIMPIFRGLMSTIYCDLESNVNYENIILSANFCCYISFFSSHL